jgi:hypothetical protein
VHDENDQTEGVVDLRRLHVELDDAVADAYGWSQLDLDHGFHDTAQGSRFTIGPTARAEVLDLLLEENHRRHAAEQAPQRPATGTRGRRVTKPQTPGQVDMFDGGLQ